MNFDIDCEKQNISVIQRNIYYKQDEMSFNQQQIKVSNIGVALKAHKFVVIGLMFTLNVMFSS